MQETGDVVEIRDGRAAVQVRRERDQRCAGCTVCQALGDRGLVLWVEAADLRVGDRVTVDVPLVGPWRALTLVFALPLVAILVGLIAGSRWEGLQTSLGLTSDFAALALGAVGGVAAFLVARLVDRRFSRRHRPRVLQVHRSA